MTGVPTTLTPVGGALQKRLQSRDRPTPVKAPLIASDALKCARRIGFRLFGQPYDIAFTQDERARFEDGDYVDSTAAEVFAREVNGSIQVPFNWLPEVPLKGKADAGYRRDGERVLAEVKSQNERGWSRAVGLWNNVPPGPKAEWVLQGGLGACSPTVAAKWLHIVLVDNDRLVVDEWMIDVDSPITLPDEPMVVHDETGEMIGRSVRDRVHEELRRQLAILALCEVGRLPAREIPGWDGLVLEPPSRDESGDPWHCRYCPFQPTCSKLPAEQVPDFGEMAA